MKTTELESIVHENNPPCISIIIPTERTARKHNYESFKKAVQMAVSIVDKKPYGAEAKTSVVAKLNDIMNKLPALVQNGLGVFISPVRETIVTFPFAVKQKVIVSDAFETRELFYLKQYLTPYYVLNLTNRVVHLYRAEMDKLEEIRDGKFPLLIEDQYEYTRPSVASGGSNTLKAYEKDKSIISAIRVKTMLKDADTYFMPYVSREDPRVIVAGSQKVISSFLAITHFSENIVGKVHGSFKDENISELGGLAWSALMRYQKSDDEKTIQHLMERKSGDVVEGVQKAWTAAQEGKGLLLAVEKDFHCLAYEQSKPDKISLQPPKKPYKIIPDAVDDLIKTVSNKNGRVIFLENGQLRNSGHVALVLRY